MEQRTYIAIDLKSFYASVECIERGLNPLTTNLVVADESRTSKTICLAVSPALKAHGIGGRPRLFEVIRQVAHINRRRCARAPRHELAGESTDADELAQNPALAVAYHIAPPRMTLYMDYSMRIYEIYLRRIAPADIHIYSIDEMLIDVTNYLRTEKISAHAFTIRLIRDVLRETGITATAGIGTNLYLAKIAMDIVAKRIAPDADGVRIAELDETSYRRRLWTHMPLTDFWRVGRVTAKKLEEHGLDTMGDIARCSIGDADAPCNEDLLYRLFGIQAELLIDHAWGWEPARMEDIKNYRPKSRSAHMGQVLQTPYTAEKARLVVWEMADALSLDLAEKRLTTDRLELTVGYDIECLTRPEIRSAYQGRIRTDRYGRRVPWPAHGRTLLQRGASTHTVMEALTVLYDEIANPALLIRRLTISAQHLIPADEVPPAEQIDLFSSEEAAQTVLTPEEKKERAKEHALQEALVAIKKAYGKNAILRGANLVDGATARLRNDQIGGHKA
ncbi:Y-family DNA polymerase [Selenomonas sp. F0473]|uniref:Y-family DNA polymerase n=1 Tax=Selenomonas sp. F0473 TaxID=999423 RepID=UPI0025F08826|nr:type VI secretion protein ImpB [Selenomonas sp. F0473]